MPLRAAWPLLFVVAGLALGVVWLLLEPTRYRAVATVVVERDQQPVAQVAPTIAQLVASDSVLANAAQRLGLRGAGAVRPHLHAHTAAGSIHLAYDGPSATESVRVLQEVTVVLGVLTLDRFHEQAVVFDPARATGRVSPHPARDLTVGGSAGLLAAVAFGFLRGRRRENGRYRISRLRRAVARERAASPERAADWDAYLAVLAAQSDGDFVPHVLDRLVRDVFGELAGKP